MLHLKSDLFEDQMSEALPNIRLAQQKSSVKVIFILQGISEFFHKGNIRVHVQIFYILFCNFI